MMEPQMGRATGTGWQGRKRWTGSNPACFVDTSTAAWAQPAAGTKPLGNASCLGYRFSMLRRI
eukprot:11175159-Lingulodinium_polyedra.AAC.1